jgi:hypothetical protein
MFTGVCCRNSIDSVVATSAAAAAVSKEVTQPQQQANPEHAAVLETPDNITFNDVTVAAHPEQGHELQPDSIASPQHVQEPAALQELQQPAEIMEQQQQQFWEQEQYEQEQDDSAAAAGPEGLHVLLPQQQQDDKQHLEHNELYASSYQTEKTQQAVAKQPNAVQHYMQPRQPQQQPQIQQLQQQHHQSAATSQTVVQLQQELMQQAKLREVRLLQGSSATATDWCLLLLVPSCFFVCGGLQNQRCSPAQQASCRVPPITTLACLLLRSDDTQHPYMQQLYSAASVCSAT